jgi:hypothetical protein
MTLLERQEKLIFSHEETNYRTKRGDFGGQAKSILGYNETKFGTN